MRGNFRSVLLETLAILLLGLAFALVANQLSPRGLSLKRNYFAYARTPQTDTNVVVNRPAPPPEAGTNAAASANPPRHGDAELEQRLAQKGLSLIDVTAAEKLFRDPQYEQELIVFVDARNDHHYQEGHIPGAYQLDRYYPERYLPTVIPPCMSAAQIVVYCTGGKCEDSEFAALMLVEAGVPAPGISVFAGGITDWLARKLPVELGARKSGSLKPAAQ